jgi:hypothetical protein
MDNGNSTIKITFTLHPSSNEEQINTLLKKHQVGYTLTGVKEDGYTLETLRSYLKDRRAALLQSKQAKNGLHDPPQVSRTRVYSE